MRETGEYTASGQLWNTRKEFMQSLADDHKREVTSVIVRRLSVNSAFQS